MHIHRLITTIFVPILVSQLLILIIDFENLDPVEEEWSEPSNLEKCLKGEATEELKVVGLGDSLTVGIGDEYNLSGYYGRLVSHLKEINCHVSENNFSKKGYTTKDLLKQLEDDEISEAITEADTIILTIGANDLISVLKEVHLSLQFDLIEKAQKQYEKNIEKVLTEIRTLNKEAEIYYIGFYNPITDKFGVEYLDSLVTTWNNISERHVKKMDHTYFVKIDDIFKHEPKRFLSEDRFHPNYLGYEVIMQRILSFMLNRYK